ncbi:aromatic-ring-hydroxylating dioxygenase subunit beta [Actinomycetospora chibensis]|uniref:Aromatic-ring-hydroxylating dioxygenase subunit beta n=1 Tax=Actinomycetospora chibensis TaxID=663606 RepID=A0ABV9RD28_9PSEU|nr:aromatic-ring-hydroxylating dioxygenase subunit beta [Actinomycetospora chibensis]MDD7925070.1 aromatic-ring-hydroxylating dioxygenase subunit beta [Actinomycetospora chibensis]
MTAAAQSVIDGTPAPVGEKPGAVDGPIGHLEVEQFLYREARLADTHELDAWEALWTDDAVYHVPVDDSWDPRTHMSIIFDNRGRIATRIKQLHTGRRHAQRPPSRLVRIVSNIEIVGTEGTDTVVSSVVQVIESRERDTRTWAGRVTHKLRRVDGGLAMAYKKVVLVDSDRPLLSLSFLI